MRKVSNIFLSRKKETPLAPEKFQSSGLNYRTIFESMEEGFCCCQMMYDKAGKPVDFRYLYVNPAFAKQTGLPVEKVVGHTVREVIPKIEPFWIETYGRVAESGKSENFENGVVSIGKQFNIKAWPTGAGYFAVLFEDITNRKKEEAVVKSTTKRLENLAKSQEETKKAMFNVMEDLEEAKAVLEIEKAKDDAILASIGDGIVAIDKDGKVIVINKAGCDLLGFKDHELLGKKFIDMVGMTNEKGDTIPKDKRPAHIAITGSKPTTTTTTTTTTVGPVYHYVRKDTTQFPVAITATPIVSGKTIGAIEVFRDITHEIEIDKVKSEFVSLASHQLRTPLGIIKWYLEALENDDYFKKAPLETQKYFDEIYKSNERVLSLVRDLLSVSRIEQGRVKNIPKPVDILQAIKEIVEQMQIVARKKRVALSLTIQDQKIPAITLDSLRFHEVIENLINNALEYTKDAGNVDVAVKKVGDTLLISVKDTGIGISPADRKKIFTKFFRSENAVKQNPEGSGLGLYVVKSYVEGWGGEMAVESVEGKGSIFTMSIPISQKESAKPGGERR